MIPIRDTIPSKNYPIVNTSLIGINILVYLLQLTQGADLERFVYYFGLVPARYTVPQISFYFTTSQQLIALFSFMFLHGGFLHLLGNMWTLYIFGDNVEDRLGPFRYLFFYLICGLASGASHFLFNAQSNMPVIGASGAIAGVMGAYLLLYPRSKILTLIPILIIPLFFEIRAYFFLGFWFLMQFLNATVISGGSNIAWWAHIGGFVGGMVLIKALLTLPKTGISEKLKKITAKRKSEQLQILRPTGSDTEPHLYGTLRITTVEAISGTRKVVNIPRGFGNRLIRVNVPPGTKANQVLRLNGMGKMDKNGMRGNLYLKIEFTPLPHLDINPPYTSQRDKGPGEKR